jgi:hypothetical protein
LITNTVYDANNRLDPGETADFTATLVNIGGADLTNLSTTIQTSSSYITINDDAGYFGSLPIDTIKENTGDPYTVTASSSTPQGAPIDFTLIAVADNSYCDTLDFTLIVGENAPTDSGYYYSYFTGGPHINCPTFNWRPIDSTQTANPGTSLDLTDNETEVVSLPFTFMYYGVDYNQISICSNGWIAMGSQSSTMDWTNSSIPHPDGPNAMIAGLWDDLDPGNAGAPSDIYYYYDATDHIFIVEYFQVEHWPSGDMETFEIILYDPAYYPSPTGDGDIIVQYLVEQQQWDNTLGIENSSQNLGIEYFYNDVYHQYAAVVTDEFAIRYTTWPPDQTGIEEYKPLAISDNTSFNVSPSIAKYGINISYMLGHGLETNLNIYDASGRLVRSFTGLNRAATMTWDLRDQTGEKVASGIYFVQIKADDFQAAQKVIIID